MFLSIVYFMIVVVIFPIHILLCIIIHSVVVNTATLLFTGDKKCNLVLKLKK